ncbi:MAG: DUF599 domain-containing protein [Pseudomonadota bacterium]
MTWADRLALFTPLDAAALATAIAAWLALSVLIENPPSRRPSTSSLMAEYRRAWMDQMITRQPRIFDAQIIGSLRQSTAFFASTAVLAIGGTLALMGNAEALTGIASDFLLIADPAFVWELKLVLVALFLTNGFLKFVWSNRLFGYASVLMAAVPNDAADPLSPVRAEQAAEINITAARAFNRGLRSIYFALTAAAWLAGPIAFLVATAFTSIVILRREFASQSRRILLKSRL